MPRVVSLNYEIEKGGKTLYPLSVGEFAPYGEEGRAEVADGSRKYKIRDGIKMFDEIEIVFNLRKTQQEDIDVLNEWVESGAAEDINVIGKDAAQNIIENWLLEDCELSSGKKSGFDRKSKAETTRRFFLLPRDISDAR